MSFSAPMASSRTSGLPRGELLGRYRSYEDAQKVVDHLAAAESFDVKTLTIVGNDLRTVEHIRSRLSYPRVAGAGAAQGAMFGAFIGLLLVLFSPEAPLVNMLLAVLLGMAIWMIVAVVGYAIRRGRRDFASSSQLVANSFDVVCDFSVAAHARQLVPGAGVPSVSAADDPSSASAAGMGPHRPVEVPSGLAQSAHAQPGGERPGHEQPTGHDHGGSQPGGEQPSAGEPSSGEPSGVGYGDLPDGRPRYGVRVERSAPSSSSASSAASAPSAERDAAVDVDSAEGDEPAPPR